MINNFTKNLTTSKLINITDRCAELEAVAIEWQNRKRGTPGLYEMKGQQNSFVVGLKGEAVYARLVGLEEEISLDYKAYGDTGEDFKNSVDVKTSVGNKNSYLIENKEVKAGKCLKKQSKWAKYYVKVVLNESLTGGWVVGWTTKERLLNGEIIDFGNGPRYTVAHEDLNPFNTEINYIFNIHNQSMHLPEGELKDYLHNKYKADYIEWHREYQKKVKMGIV
ncbi:hypothetical protein MUN82_10315 [Hymenobacter aerilatus]|uniref:HNH endonuclease n=1 Tax=Hymenobacter aerilatus TaxID=2932251 RepID=A0A8T9T1E8_9BACT|nr:hypothetical protein [Hymenobacter aerilatus]UOR07471.1 hypothetical protein MUN82_10315 [Hymenobacter aerilatus]